MKSSSSIFGLALAVLIFLPWANAQSPFVGGFNGGGQLFEPATARAVQGSIAQSIGFPGSVWFSANYADQGLGFRGSYLTGGLKTRLFEDALDGRWLFEARGHISEEGGFFGNFGLERVFSVRPANADVSLGVWFDYDDDQDAFAFADTLQSWGVSGKIKTRHWDLLANGYFPIGTSDTTQGTAGIPFFENSLVLVPGFDSGLEGFDVTIRTRPAKLAFANGSFDFGGYGYNSDLVEFFGGGRIRMNLQLRQGMILTGELNYDDRFNTTGILGVTLLYGGNPRGHEYSPLGNDLERTARNDHIVRFNQDVVLAFDPDTGAAYNVIHVNNTAGAGGNGTFETPFDNLAAAQAASGPDDIIFVDRGDGTVTGHTTGIALQDGQQFLASGVSHQIPIDNGPGFGDFVVVEVGLSEGRPVITGENNGSAIELANRNTVRGFEIDGTQAPGGLSNGIFGSAFTTNTDGIIEDVQIRGALLNGISITNFAGDWTFSRNDIQENGFSGISLIDHCDATSVLNFDSNIVSNNIGGNGIEIINYDAAEINFTNNITDGNGMAGVLLQGFKGNDAVGSQITFDNHTARENIGAGISVVDGVGNLTVMNSVLGTEIEDDDLAMGVFPAPTGNTGAGLNIVDFQTFGDDRVLIADNDINGNGSGIGAGINLELNEGFTRALITGNQIDLNGIGIRGFADTATPNATLLDVDIIDNVSIGNLPLVGGFVFGTGNALQGVRFITTGQALGDVLIDQNGGNLQVLGNGFNGLDFLAEEESSLQALVRNVTVASSGASGVFGQTTEDGQLSLLVEDSVIGRDVNNPDLLAPLITVGNANGFTFAFDNEEGGQVNTVVIRNVQVSDNFFNGFTLTTAPGTFTDVAIIDTNFTNPFLGPARTDGLFDGVNPIGNPDAGFGIGISVTAVGDGDQIMNPQIDNRTRFFLQSSTVDRFTLEGLDIVALGDANVFADVIGNTITNNGDGFDGGGQPDTPFFNGIDLDTAGMAQLNINISGNLINGNAEAGIDFTTGGMSSINGSVVGNNLLGNDITEDAGTPAIEANGFDVEALNNVGSNLALAFSNNALDLSTLVNNGAIGDFILELDGFSNGIIFANPFPANITQADFGTVVEPANEAASAAFMLEGFPPSPPPFP